MMTTSVLTLRGELSLQAAVEFAEGSPGKVVASVSQPGAQLSGVASRTGQVR